MRGRFAQWTICAALACACLTAGEVTVQDLLEDEDVAADWLNYHGGYSGHRHSLLDQIDRSNVGSLRLAWAFQERISEKFEVTPLVHDGIMYITVPPGDVYALDAETGARLWRYSRRMPPKLIACCGLVNRGLAILGDRLFMATLDAYAIALDRKTGRLLWETKLIDFSLGYSGTHAPLVVKDLVMVGTAGGEYGIRGFIDAFDVETGERRWRFYTIPGPGEFGHDTWAGDSWKTGGASIWITPSYDPALNLVYWGVGNPGPDWNGDVRLGDNLFSDSVVALDADTGKRKWHFQFTPHDVHDWDATQVMVLLDKEYRGRTRKLLVTANRNGFIYLLDRETGEFLRATQFVKQTWAVGISEEGRPIRRPGMEPSAEGVEVYPTVAGGTNWMSPAYSPDTGLLYVSCREGSSTYYKGETEYTPGTRYWGSMFVNEPTMHNWYGAVRAFDPVTAELKWEHRLFRASLGRSGLHGGQACFRGHFGRLLQGAGFRVRRRAVANQSGRRRAGQPHRFRGRRPADDCSCGGRRPLCVQPALAPILLGGGRSHRSRRLPPDATAAAGRRERREAHIARESRLNLFSPTVAAGANPRSPLQEPVCGQGRIHGAGRLNPSGCGSAGNASGAARAGVRAAVRGGAGGRRPVV